MSRVQFGVIGRFTSNGCYLTSAVYDRCGNRYSANILQAVRSIATGVKSPERTEQIPVAHLERECDLLLAAALG